MHHPTDRIAHTTAFVTPVVEHRLERENVFKDTMLTSPSLTTNHLVAFFVNDQLNST